MGSNRGKWGAKRRSNRDLGSRNSTRCCRTPGHWDIVHPKQTVTLMEMGPKVNRNRAWRGAFRLIFGACAVASFLGASPYGALTASAAKPGAPGGPPLDSLVILHTNDVHSHLDPYDVGARTVGGAAARAALIAREAALGGRVIVLDAGDLVQGTPYYNQFRGEPDHKILDLLKYDVIALGNHDLDDGAEAWAKRAAATRTPIVSANVLRISPNGNGDVPPEIARTAKWIGGGKVAAGSRFSLLAKPYVILERGGLRIAVLGLTTYSIDRIVAARYNAGVAVANPITAARYWVPLLRKQADVVVALTHLGVDQDRVLVDRVPGIDVVIGGHSHTPLFAPVFETAGGMGGATAITQAGLWGRWVGRTTLRWSRDGRVRGTTSRLIEVRPADGEDQRVASLVASYRRRLGSGLDRVVFRTPASIAMDGKREGDHPLGNFVADVMRARMNADLAVMNAGGIRAGFPAGDVRERDVLTMLPFDNHLTVVSLTGTQIRRLLDRFAARLGKSGFGHVSGLSYTIQGGRAMDIRVWSAGQRGSSTWHGRTAGPGAPLDANAHYRVATIDFLANGGDYFDELRDGTNLETTSILLSDAAIAFLRDHPDYRFGRDGRVQWRGSGEALRGLRIR